jgi:hypothetical protein
MRMEREMGEECGGLRNWGETVTSFCFCFIEVIYISVFYYHGY